MAKNIKETAISIEKSIQRHIIEEIHLHDEIIEFLFDLCEKNGGSISNISSSTGNKDKRITMLYIDAEDGELWVSINDSEDFHIGNCTEDIFPLFGTIRQMIENGEIK